MVIIQYNFNNNKISIYPDIYSYPNINNIFNLSIDDNVKEFNIMKFNDIDLHNNQFCLTSMKKFKKKLNDYIITHKNISTKKHFYYINNYFIMEVIYKINNSYFTYYTFINTDYLHL
jgi:hypothetical protein